MHLSKPSLAPDRSLLPVVLLALVLFVCPLALRTPLLDPDEGLHAAIAQEMVEHNDWVMPQLIGEPFLDKPIFYFWCEALSLRLFGDNEAAVRLPGMLLSILGVATTGLLAGWMFGRAAGLLSAAFYATTILPTAMSQSPVHDVALVPMVNLAVLCFWRSQEAASARARWGAVVLAGVVLGLSLLTKGLVGVALVGLGYGMWLILTRRLSLVAVLQGALALTIAGLLAAGWYAAMEARVPGYCRYFLFERHVLGYATATQRHGSAAWWYYLPVILLGGLPWVAYLPLYLIRGRDGATDDGPQRRARLLLWCWLTIGVLVLSLARSKLPTYAWPLFPPAAMLAALLWRDLLGGRLAAAAERGVAATLYFSCLGSPVVILVAAKIAARHFRVSLTTDTWVMALLVGLLGVLPGLFYWSARRRAALSAALTSCALQFVWIMTWLMPQIAPATSAVALARHFNAAGCLPPRVTLLEERIGSLLFYLDPPLRAAVKPGQFDYAPLRDLIQGPAGEPGDLVVIPAEWSRRANAIFAIDRLPATNVGLYRIYDAAALWSVRRPTAGPAQEENKGAHDSRQSQGPPGSGSVADP